MEKKDKILNTVKIQIEKISVSYLHRTIKTSFKTLFKFTKIIKNI